MRTTININIDLLNRLKNTSEIIEVSTNDLISMLVTKVSSKNIFDITTFKGIKYQNADPENKWHKFHIKFEPQIYEMGLDLRKCFKLSVSFIISFAIIHFLDELIEKFTSNKTDNKKVDNYPLNYIFIVKNYNGIQGFIVLWGIPEEKDLENLLK